MSRLPEIVYKYMPPSMVNALAHPSIKYTHPSEFNDLFDSDYISISDEAINVPGSPIYFLDSLQAGLSSSSISEEIQEFVRQSRRLVPGFKLKGVCALPPSKDEQARAAFFEGLRGALDHFWRDCLVSCFSEVRTSKMMWSLYADRHRGFAIGISTHAPFFQTELGPRLEKVNYAETPPRGPTGMMVLSRHLMKDKVWAFEREWRSVATTEAAREEISAAGEKIYVRDLAREDIVEVVIGARMSQAAEQVIRRLLPPKARLLRCARKSGEYKLLLEEVRP